MADLKWNIANPWLHIWFSPRRTIREVVDNTHPDQYAPGLAAMAGFAETLNMLWLQGEGGSGKLLMIFLAALISGLIIGPLSLYLSGALLRWSGSLFGGVASSTETRAVVAWSAVPQIFALGVWIPRTVFVEPLRESPQALDAPPWLYGAFFVFDLVIAAWTLVILVQCLAEVHRFSAKKAIVVTLLAWLTLVALLLSFVVILSAILPPTS